MSSGVRRASLALGVMMIVGGICGMWFGALNRGVHVVGTGVFDGFWSTNDYFLIGVVAAVVGSGLFTYAYLSRRDGFG